MWTAEQRRIYQREGDGYPSDLRDVKWARLAPLIPPALLGGRPRTDMRAAMSAILYLLRTGCPWHYLPRDSFPCTISFASSSDLGRSAYGIARANGSGDQPLGGGSRQPVDKIGRKRGGNDNQVGYDAGNEVKGRKIHALVYSEGLPMRVVVHSAVIQDRDGAGLVLDKIRRRFPWLDLIWADGGSPRRRLRSAIHRTKVGKIGL